MKKLRLIIADDHSLVRQGVRSVIEGQKTWTLCGEADNGRTAVELAKRLKPDIAVLDVSMPKLSGLDAVRILKTQLPKTKVLILTMHDSDSLADELLAAGAHGYLLKSDAAELLPKAIGALMAGKTFLTPKITPVPGMGASSPPTCSDHPNYIRFRLSSRERQIVQLLAEGRSNKETAETLAISVNTIESHRKNILDKLELRCTADLVRYAIRNNLVQA